jgi:hypothetical protein
VRSVLAARSAKTKELGRKLGERNGQRGLPQRLLVCPRPRPMVASPLRNVCTIVPPFDFHSHLTSSRNFFRLNCDHFRSRLPCSINSFLNVF